MGKSTWKARRREKLRISRERRRQAGKIVRFDLQNAPKAIGPVRDKYSYQSNMHNLKLNNTVISNVNYRASNITECNFRGTRLEGVDFLHVNLRGSNFKNATLKEVIFFNANLKGVNFENAKFENVYFICTNITDSRNLESTSGFRKINQYEDKRYSLELEKAIFDLATIEKIYKYHTLHVTKKKINKWFVNILLESYSEEELSRAFRALLKRKDKRRFYTFHSINSFLKNYLKI